MSEPQPTLYVPFDEDEEDYPDEDDDLDEEDESGPYEITLDGKSFTSVDSVEISYAHDEATQIIVDALSVYPTYNTTVSGIPGNTSSELVGIKMNGVVPIHSLVDFGYGPDKTLAQTFTVTAGTLVQDGKAVQFQASDLKVVPGDNPNELTVSFVVPDQLEQVIGHVVMVDEKEPKNVTVRMKCDASEAVAALQQINACNQLKLYHDHKDKSVKEPSEWLKELRFRRVGESIEQEPTEAQRIRNQWTLCQRIRMAQREAIRKAEKRFKKGDLVQILPDVFQEILKTEDRDFKTEKNRFKIFAITHRNGKPLYNIVEIDDFGWRRYTNPNVHAPYYCNTMELTGDRLESFGGA